jgi:threonine efflux protein
VLHYVTILAGIAAIHWAALISPGPNFLLITQASSAESRRIGLWTAVGVVIGTVVWATTALLGVSVIFSQFVWLYKGMKFVGGAYLVYLGIRAWVGATRPIQPDRAARTTPSHWLALRRGFLTHITNPKTTLFYAGIFAATLTPELPQWVKAAAFGVVLADSLIWHTTLALVFSTDRAQRAYLRAKLWVDRITGTVMTAFGTALALS